MDGYTITVGIMPGFFFNHVGFELCMSAGMLV